MNCINISTFRANCESSRERRLIELHNLRWISSVKIAEKIFTFFYPPQKYI